MIQDEEARKRATSAGETRARVLEHDFPELVHTTGLAPTIKENPPLIYHWRELGHEEHMEIFKNAFARYRETLAEHLRMLLDHFQLMDTAIKVVGVGSVGRGAP